MATLAGKNPTLMDWAKLQDPKGRISKIVELLAQTNEVYEDMTWIMANKQDGHQTTVRTGLPTVYWSAINEYVPESKTTTAQVTEGIGRARTWNQVDSELVDMSDTPNDFRLSQAEAHMQAITHEFCSTLFYGNATIDVKEFNGLSMRYSSTSAGTASNLILGGGSDPTDNASVWLIVWHPMTISGIFPKGSKAGIEHKNYGRIVSENSTGLLEVFRDRWTIKGGVHVSDWRQAGRICNLDVSAMRADTSAPDVRKMMLRLMNRIKYLKMGRPIWYMNRTILEYLDVQGYNKVGTAGPITKETVDGIPKRDFAGIPVKICDALLTTEALVS